MAPWRALSTKRRAEHVPFLFVKGEFTDSSYTVFLTDLVYLWAEQLDRRAIMRRAMNEDTTIDPTNGPDQLKTLLEHLSDCLEGKPGTTAVLTSDSNHEQLNLVLNSKLPAPLEPLRWPLSLKLDVQEQFSAELLQPALGALKNYRTGLVSLVSLLKEKDNVIQKLQDKIEVSGMDLSAVFPGAGLRRGTTAKQSKRAVPGLAEFDYDSWVSSTPNLEVDPLVMDNLPRVSSLGVRKAAPNGAPWWEDLPANDQEMNILDQAAHASHLHDTSAGFQMASADATDGKRPREVQQTRTEPFDNSERTIPERQKALRKGSQSSTSSEEDTSQFEQMRPQPAKHPVKVEVEETAPLTSTLASSESPHQKQVPSSPPPPKRIGKLGGKKQPSPIPATSERIPETQIKNAAGQPSTPPKKVSKLGKIGGAGKVSNSESKDSGPVADNVTLVKNEASMEREARNDTQDHSKHDRETSQERADRRRAELKRQLEEKRRAPGAKKKQRKF